MTIQYYRDTEDSWRIGYKPEMAAFMPKDRGAVVHAVPHFTILESGAVEQRFQYEPGTEAHDSEKAIFSEYRDVLQEKVNFDRAHVAELEALKERGLPHGDAYGIVEHELFSEAVALLDVGVEPDGLDVATIPMLMEANAEVLETKRAQDEHALELQQNLVGLGIAKDLAYQLVVDGAGDMAEYMLKDGVAPDSIQLETVHQMFSDHLEAEREYAVMEDAAEEAAERDRMDYGIELMEAEGIGQMQTDGIERAAEQFAEALAPTVIRTALERVEAEGIGIEQALGEAMAGAAHMSMDMLETGLQEVEIPAEARSAIEAAYGVTKFYDGDEAMIAAGIVTREDLDRVRFDIEIGEKVEPVEAAAPVEAEQAAPTFKQVRSELVDLGMSIMSKDGEYRVNFAGGSEDHAYYTDDLQDALGTGKSMANWKKTTIETHGIDAPALKGAVTETDRLRASTAAARAATADKGEKAKEEGLTR